MSAVTCVVAVGKCGGHRCGVKTFVRKYLSVNIFMFFLSIKEVALSRLAALVTLTSALRLLYTCPGTAQKKTSS